MGIAIVDHPPVLQTDDAVCLHRNGIIVGDEHHGVALIVHLLQHSQHFAAGVAVQCAGRLVGQNDRRVPHQRPSDGNTLLLAAGELSGIGLFFIRQTHFAEQLTGFFLRLFFIYPSDHLRLRNVFQHREMREQVKILKNKAEF